MILRLLVSTGFSWLVGLAVSGWLWRRVAGSVAAVVLVASLALGLGLGLSSDSLFLSLVTFNGIGHGVVVSDLVLLVGLGAVGAVCAVRTRSMVTATVSAPTPASAVTPTLAAVFGLSLLAVVARFGVMSLRNPNGWWDAWMIYNLRARFLLHGGAHWADAFSPLMPLSHPDYPLLVPALVVRAWSYLGRETTIVPQGVAVVYMLGTAGLLWAALTLLRDHDQALIAGTVLMAAPLFSDTAVVQDADTPLGFYFLATMVLLAFHDRQVSAGGQSAGGIMALAGLSAGLAAWTKNEGLVFILVIAGVRFAMRLRGERWRLQLRSAAMFVLGLLPIMVVLLYFKVRFAPPNDLVISQGLRETSERLLDLRRYGIIVTNLRDIIENDGPMGVVSAVWVLAIHAVCVGFDSEHALSRAAQTALVTAGLMLAGYVTVYLTSPYDLQSHIDSSLTRLLAQVWPMALFGYFLIARTPREACA